MTRMVSRRRAMFRGSDGTYRGDPSGPLRRARARGDIGLWAWGRGDYPGEPLSDGDFPGLLSTGLWEVEADQDWGLDWHLNEGVEVTFVTRGRVMFGTEREEHELNRSWLSITRPWQRHRLGDPNVTACTLGWFVLSVEALRPNQRWKWPEWLPLPESDIRRFTEHLRGQERSVWPASADLVRSFERLEQPMRERQRHTLPRLAIGITDVLLGIADLLEGDDQDFDPYFSSTERTVELFLDGLRSRLSEPWTVDSMSAACGLGRTRFIHYCRQVVSAAPADYLNGLRLDRTLELLVSTDLSVADIAYQCGFSSSQYLATMFKEQFGRTPTEARSQGRAATAAFPPALA
jgi:AraC family L-rhamnose operon regulatory protein RhaS